MLRLTARWSHRDSRLAGVLGLVLLAVAGCAGTVPNPAEASPAGSVPGATTAVPVPPRPSRPSSAPTAAPAGFPGAARAYAEAALTAWAGHQVSRLSDLTTPVVRQQILELPGLPNQDWTYHLCDRAAASSYCAFVNGDGDMITLRVANDRVSKPNAITEARFDRTTYPRDAVEYVKGFVEAWRNVNSARLLALSGPAEAAYVNPNVAPEAYSVCAVAAGQIWQVRVYNTGGGDYLFGVSASALGGKHAITSHASSPGSPPPCA